MHRKERIVHPDWIVQSCAQGELLPWHQFALYRGPLPSQRPLSFAKMAEAGPSSAAATVANDPDHANETAPPPLPNDEDGDDDDVDGGVGLDEDDNEGAVAGLDDDESEEPPPMRPEPPSKGKQREDDDDDDGGGWRSDMMGRGMVEREAAAFRSDWVQQNISTHPDFLARYFASSRLHFLSTWKNEFTKLVGDIMT